MHAFDPSGRFVVVALPSAIRVYEPALDSTFLTLREEQPITLGQYGADYGPCGIAFASL